MGVIARGRYVRDVLVVESKGVLTEGVEVVHVGLALSSPPLGPVEDIWNFGLDFLPRRLLSTLLLGAILALELLSLHHILRELLITAAHLQRRGMANARHIHFSLLVSRD